MGAALTNTMEIAGLTMGTYQSYQDSKITAYQNELAANDLEARAEKKILEADHADALGRLEQMEQGIAGRRDVSAKRAEYAASGVKVDSGSAADVAADTAAWNEYGRQKIEYETGLESWALRYDAALIRNDAANVRAGASASSGGSYLSQTLFTTGRSFLNTGAGKLLVKPNSAFL